MGAASSAPLSTLLAAIETIQTNCCGFVVNLRFAMDSKVVPFYNLSCVFAAYFRLVVHLLHSTLTTKPPQVEANGVRRCWSASSDSSACLGAYGRARQSDALSADVVWTFALVALF